MTDTAQRCLVPRPLSPSRHAGTGQDRLSARCRRPRLWFGSSEDDAWCMIGSEIHYWKGKVSGSCVASGHRAAQHTHTLDMAHASQAQLSPSMLATITTITTIVIMFILHTPRLLRVLPNVRNWRRLAKVTSCYQPDSSVKGFVECFAKRSRGAVESHPLLIALSSKPQRSRGCTVHSKAGPRLQQPASTPAAATSRAKRHGPLPAGRPMTSGRDVAMGDVVHRPSRLASLSAPLNHTPGQPAARRRRTIKPSSETRLLTTNVLPTPVEPTSARILLSMQGRTDPLQPPTRHAPAAAKPPSIVYFHTTTTPTPTPRYPAHSTALRIVWMLAKFSSSLRMYNASKEPTDQECDFGETAHNQQPHRSSRD